jgi:glycosyltransferase involved in cell wall biosynthesis
MKILYLAPLHSVHAQRWIKYFADRGHETHAISFIEDFERHKDVIYHQIDLPDNKNRSLIYKIWNYVFNKPRILKREYKNILDKVSPDIIHMHMLNITRVPLIKLSICPVVVSAWGSDVLLYRKLPGAKRALKTIFKRADIIHCDSPNLQKAMEKLGASNEKSRIVYFGTDCKKYTSEKKDMEFYKQFNFPEDSKIIISLRALQPVYNVETLIKAIPQIISQFSNARFVIVGRGAELEMLKELSKTLKVDDYIYFSSTFLSDEDMIRFTASADIYVSTSLSDGGLAASTAEAMACSIPPVITDFGENSSWVEHGESGFIFPLKDHKKLSEYICILLADEEKAAQMGKKACDTIVERLNYWNEMEKMEKIYKKLVDKSK